MSGDVQPRKRKDKKRKKDELGLEEPRGTAAVLGEGDVFIHSHHEHGTGGHWCAKIIFFSLLAVLIGLIGLIILENRGLSELEANAVESQYSGILEGWIEDIPEDDHHDEHTLELKHPDDEDLHDEDHQDLESDHEEEDEEHNGEGVDHIEEDDADDDKSDEEDADDNQSDEEDADDVQSDEELENEADEAIAYSAYRNIYHTNEGNEELEADDDSDETVDGQLDLDDDAEDKNDDDENESNEANDDEEEEESEINEDNDNEEIESDEENDEDNNIDNLHDYGVYEDKWQNNEVEENESDDDDDDNDIVEKLEQEISDEDIISAEVSHDAEAEDNADDDASNEVNENDNKGDVSEDEDEPPVERITLPPAGKPYTEIEEETLQSTPDTLAEEEEYERQQEELRREREAQASQGMWLKLAVGGALLVATHAVVRRATARRDEPDTDDPMTREDPPVIDRRMTLIPQTETERIIAPIQEEIIRKTTSVVQSTSLLKPEPKDDKKELTKLKEEIQEYVKDNNIEKELHSDEDEEEEEEIDEEEDEEEDIIPKKVEMKDTKSAIVTKPPVELEPDEDSEDVEIIDEEQIEEEIEDEEDEVEEEISDVDDTELLNRLEAKYGRLPEPERPGKNKGGGNSIEDEWPGEPSDPYWSQQLDLAEDELRQGAWSACERRSSAPELRGSARARGLAARALDMMAEAKRDNQLLSRAIAAYLELLKMNERLSDGKLVEISQRVIDRIKFRGTYLKAEPVYRLLIRRFPSDVYYRNNLTICFLMANRADLADEVLKETLRIWPDDRVALAHYGFVLKTEYNKLEEAVVYLQKALDGDAGPACEPRFYYHLGDALLLLQRFDEAHEVHKRGASLGHFLSSSQRSLYNVPQLKGRPWWPIDETPYTKLARSLEKAWQEILKEGLAAKALYEKEKEGLKERGEWSQLDVFVRGREIPGRCKQAPVTCSVVEKEVAATGCTRGQIKFSLIEPGTHIRPHVGPTNCRLRMHLGLSNTKDTFIRVDKETRQWEVGKVFIFDDSFEHEVWHNGSAPRLVLIVDVWHPALTPAQRRSLPAI